MTSVERMLQPSSFGLSAKSLSKTAQRWRWAVFAVSLTPIAVAFIYQWLLKPLHKKCFFQAIFNFPAPSCGLTRSFKAIARGDFYTALTYHLFGPLLFSICLCVVIHISIELLTGKVLATKYTEVLKQSQTLLWGGLLFTILFFAYYFTRLYVRYNLAPQPFDLSHLNLWQSFVAGAQAL
jgi:hypothetical protein